MVKIYFPKGKKKGRWAMKEIEEKTKKKVPNRHLKKMKQNKQKKRKEKKERRGDGYEDK
jgi:hypothetical protein